MLKYIITSKVARKILHIVLTDPGGRFYARQLERAIAEPVSAVRRELIKLQKADLLMCERERARTYYQVNRNHQIFDELTSIIRKTEE